MHGVAGRARGRHGALRRLAVAAIGAVAAVTLATSGSMQAGATSRAVTPTALKVVATSRATYLSWHNSSADGYVVQASTSSTFTSGVKTYTIRAPERTFAPYGLKPGQTYHFRVRAVVAGSRSRASKPAAAAVATHESPLRVLAYNTLDAVFDGERHPGGIGAPISKRLPKQVKLLEQSKAAVIGIEEANACMHPIPSHPCWRQIDALNTALPNYRLVDTPLADAFDGNYILYDPTVVTPVGEGGDWAVGPFHPAVDNRTVAYQEFQVNATGAVFLYTVMHTLAPVGLKYDRIRGAETESMIKQATAYAKRHNVAPIFYVGDFNTYHGEYHVHDFSGNDMRAAGIPDGVAVAQHLRDANFDSINSLDRSPRRGHGSADHIYATGGIGVKTWGEILDLRHGKFVGAIPSDHNPVYADVEIPY